MWTEGVGLAIIASFAIVFVKYKRRKNSNTLYSSKCASKKKNFFSLQILHTQIFCFVGSYYRKTFNEINSRRIIIVIAIPNIVYTKQ